MAMLGEKFPGTQFVVTGLLGPHANAHGPNEFLHIPFAKKLSASIAQVLADLRGLPLTDLAAATSANACRVLPQLAALYHHAP